MTPTDLTTLRQQLNVIIESAAQQIDEREADLAAATERLNQDRAVRAAWQQGSAAMQGRVTALIDHMRVEMARTGVSAQCLKTLRRQVLEVKL